MTPCRETDDREPSPSEPRDASDRHNLRILVLPRPERQPLFYYEARHDEEEQQQQEPSRSDSPTVAGGIRARFRRSLKTVREAEQHAPLWLRSPIEWLKSKLPADERLLMALRRARTITLIHPGTIPAEEARQGWDSYIEKRLRLRGCYLALYLVLLAPSVMIAVLPGPNVIGLWVTFRAIAHGLALYGIVRVIRGKVDIETQPSEVLDGPVITDRRKTQRVQEHFNLLGLRGRLKRERVLARLRDRKRKVERLFPVEEAHR